MCNTKRRILYVVKTQRSGLDGGQRDDGSLKSEAGNRS